MFKPLSDLVKSFGKDSGNLLKNRYQLLNQVGRGSMGQVYKAIDKSSNNTTIAIKFLSQALLDERMRRRFETEAKISALLGEQSNHIVKVKDYGLDNNQVPFYVMEYLEGDDLDQLIKNKAISLSRFLFLIRQICLGLECAHNGILVNGELAPIIHRDIKPSNIFLAKDSDSEGIIKILDFGIAQIHNSDQGTLQKSFMGTPEYCSPEQMAEDELHPTSDIYSLGVLMYRMLTQKNPIEAENRTFQAWYRAHHENNPKPLPNYLQLPKDLDTLIMRCLSKSPSDRPQNMGEIMRVIYPLEREYKSRKTSETISFNESKKSHETLPLQQIYLQSSWPSDKPQKKIVFPCLTDAQEGTFSSLWTMLESQDINVFVPKSTLCFNHFIFQESPHPMILWVNLLYCREYEPKWLPCYLDLKTEIGYQITINLCANSLYYIILFELDKPNQYQQILTVKINEEKTKQLQSFLVKSASFKGKNQAEVSKIALKKQFESIKNNILNSIDRSHK
ncbi:serine/threonine-protein kinase [Geminocystis sp.]|uniref:serine/threonine-protein kinase n=1 Tax=Geminocystis sp. TaxID=2664100 RepID=UPI003593D840